MSELVSLTVGGETDNFWQFETVLLKGSYGNDTFTNNGFNGSTAVAYNGKADGFNITRNNNGTWTVKDTDLSDGNEGTDTLTNIDQILFEDDNTRVGGDLNRNTVSAVAGVHESNVDTFHSISGGNSKATNFVIDIEGKTGLGLDFDTQKLANFINDITLPDQGIEDERLAANLLLEVAAGAQSAIPIFGAIGSTHTAYQQTLLNYEYDLQQVEAQRQAASNAVNNPDYDSSTWGEITETVRDIIHIEDFQIGIDNILLPSVKDVSNVNYAFTTLGNGVMIQAIINNKTENLALIKNNYVNSTTGTGNLSNAQFAEEISNLFKSETVGIRQNDTISFSSGNTITTFNQTPITVKANFDSRVDAENGSGTYAGDVIVGQPHNTSTYEGNHGSFELVGQFGDDLLQGNRGQDLLFGGFNGTTPIFNAFDYQDDGFDILQGGKGDDILNGGTGNDTLDGGGSTYSENREITGVITDDGTDTLTGGSGNDTFIFNTQSTGVDTITDFTPLIDKIQIGSEFGATSNDQFSLDNTDGGLSFNGEQFATLSNYATLDGFDVSRDIELV